MTVFRLEGGPAHGRVMDVEVDGLGLKVPVAGYGSDRPWAVAIYTPCPTKPDEILRFNVRNSSPGLPADPPHDLVIEEPFGDPIRIWGWQTVAPLGEGGYLALVSNVINRMEREHWHRYGDHPRSITLPLKFTYDAAERPPATDKEGENE